VSLEATRAALAADGLDLAAPLCAADHDACVPDEWRAPPGCRSVLVVGNAGAALWRRFSAARPRGRDPLDRFVRTILQRHAPGAFATYRERREGRPLPLIALAERAGLGRPGRIGLLLHPIYGPWISLRAVVYSSQSVESSEIPDFDPCNGCPAPCVTACRGQAIASQATTQESFDGGNCFRTKLLDGGCRIACDARAACVIGREHAFPRDAVAHHSRLHWTPGLVLRAARTLARRQS
jgi:hypothetical protein